MPSTPVPGESPQRRRRSSGERASRDDRFETGLLDLFPPAVAFLHRQAPHERFHGVDLAVVDLERLPHRQLIAAALAHAPGHAQPDDAHALIHSDDARLHVTEALEDCQRLGGDVLAAGGELAVWSGHYLAVLVTIGVGRE